MNQYHEIYFKKDSILDAIKEVYSETLFANMFD